MKEKIMKRFTTSLPYLVAHTLAFYIFPLLIKDTGSGMFFLLLVTPVILLISGFLYGLREGFCILPAILTGLIFIPVIFLFYNESAMIYAGLFPILVLTGTGIGGIFYNKR